MFNPLQEILTLDLDWMKVNGWTLRGILAYRHILYEYNHTEILPQTRVTEIIKQYDAERQTYKIIEALQDLLLLKQLFSERNASYKPPKITDEAWEDILSDYR